MIFPASLQKISAMYAAFELRSRVRAQTAAAIAGGLSTTTVGWQNIIIGDLQNAWGPTLNAAFPNLPQGFPDIGSIFSFSDPNNIITAEDPTITDSTLDGIGEFGQPQGQFKDWMRLMLRQSNNNAASACILALSYPYINGALTGAGFFPGFWHVSPRKLHA